MTNTQKTVALTCAVLSVILFAIYLVGLSLGMVDNTNVPYSEQQPSPSATKFFPNAEKWSIFYGK